MCGEHGRAAVCPRADEGSSPRVRGTLGRVQGGRPPRGIIPACAGNTRCSESAPCRGRDHPRVCGEHAHSFHELVHGLGSSPRVRGTLQRCYIPDMGEGIIPACAGNTMGELRRDDDRGDHPRVCGEHRQKARNLLATAGSSPRVRGTPGRRWCCELRPGIIPACAGNTVLF